MKSCTVCSDGNIPDADHSIVSLTGAAPEWLPTGCLVLNASLKLPIRISYSTPESLGSDRIAAASAAWVECGHPLAVIDAGTCITVDYVDAKGVYRGGAILPGIAMKFRALHNFTARLPLLNIDEGLDKTNPIGESTYGSIASGVVCATRYALEGYVRELSADAGCDVDVVVTGGDAGLVAGKWDIQPNLVMYGLHRILMMNI